MPLFQLGLKLAFRSGSTSLRSYSSSECISTTPFYYWCSGCDNWYLIMALICISMIIIAWSCFYMYIDFHISSHIYCLLIHLAQFLLNCLSYWLAEVFNIVSILISVSYTHGHHHLQEHGSSMCLFMKYFMHMETYVCIHKGLKYNNTNPRMELAPYHLAIKIPAMPLKPCHSLYSFQQ